eukprot:1194968-Prorocentrum_minimum.AAC.6
MCYSQHATPNTSAGCGVLYTFVASLSEVALLRAVCSVGVLQYVTPTPGHAGPSVGFPGGSGQPPTAKQAGGGGRGDGRQSCPRAAHNHQIEV